MRCLGILGEELRKLGINAEFENWTGKILDSYWIYTYIETDNNYETNCKEGYITIDGFTRKGISLLEDEKEKIIEKFIDFRKTVDNTTVYLGSANGQLIDTQGQELKRIQINIDFKEWRF
ncbi:MAG: hypothetical protein HFJ48_03745 [Clostridia bacterium]|nr:hypothetical protein [Clostridia bacterium]